MGGESGRKARLSKRVGFGIFTDNAKMLMLHSFLNNGAELIKRNQEDNWVEKLMMKCRRLTVSFLKLKLMLPNDLLTNVLRRNDDSSKQKCLVQNIK